MILVVAAVALTISIGIYAYTRHTDSNSKVGDESTVNEDGGCCAGGDYEALYDNGDGNGNGNGKFTRLLDNMSDQANGLMNTLKDGLESVGRRELGDDTGGDVNESLFKPSIHDTNAKNNHGNTIRLLEEENEGSGI